jgi:hypothetical protein
MDKVDCDAWGREYDSYDYSDLLNTTFALVPGGRSPGTFRLTEAMAAAAIPVFVDQFTDGETRGSLFLTFTTFFYSSFSNNSFSLSFDSAPCPVLIFLLLI